jgi:hypothetical protein
MKLKNFEVILDNGTVIWVDVEVIGLYIHIDKVVGEGNAVLDAEDLEHIIPIIDEQVNRYLDGHARRMQNKRGH